MLSRPLLVALCFALTSSTFLGNKCLSVAQTAPLILSGQDCVESNSCPTTTTMVLARQAKTGSPQPTSTQTFGLGMYPNVNFQGEVTMNVSASVNASIPLRASYQIFGPTWAAMSSPSGNRIIIWDSAPDISNLPINASQNFAITDIQSSACSPPCSGSGVCSHLLGQCLCPKGFNGTLCENCADGFFGPTCQPCPSNCTDCDQGISGTGFCLDPPVVNASASACTSKNQCTCPPGFAFDGNGTACTQCEPGFFLASTGSCQVCQLGCTECAAGTGKCLSCKTGFTQNPSDATTCDPLPSLTSGGSPCPSGAFGAGQNCSDCSPSCMTCNGPSSNNCITCSGKHAMFNNSCVATDASGICEGTNGLIANNNKKECESCGAVTANCASCKIPDFNVTSTVDLAQCTGCLPGFFLANGTCVKTCPSGTFTTNNSTSCTRCSSNCSTCAGSPDHCLTCTTGLASAGKCVSTCPSRTFATNNTCVSCHPDCDGCQGPSFDQCSSCSPSLPVLSSGRCLQTCNKTQFFNTTTSACQGCDSSCSSCSGSGPNQCLGCTNSSILQAGVCVPVPTLVRRVPIQTQTLIIPFIP